MPQSASPLRLRRYMKGLELSQRYFETYGRPMLERDFQEVLPYLAAGLAGSGSECFGYDDEVSEDHDFEPGFCIFLPDESIVDSRTEFRLMRAYTKLPREFEGYERGLIAPVGGTRHGVMRTADFFTAHIGGPAAPATYEQWVRIPEYARAEALNGRVYFDDYGEFTAIREALADMPEDVRRKRLAGNLLLAAQSGQYNFSRCIAHHEYAAAQMAVFEYVKAVSAVIFLLNRRPMPFYKWQFRAMRDLPMLADCESDLEYLMTVDNGPDQADIKMATIEKIAGDIIAALEAQGLTQASCGDLEKHAYSVNDAIKDGNIRNYHILDAV